MDEWSNVDIERTENNNFMRQIWPIASSINKTHLNLNYSNELHKLKQEKNNIIQVMI